MSEERLVDWAYLGRQPYRPIAELQEELRRGVRFGDNREHLLLLEHEPVFTVGRNAGREDVTADPIWLAEKRIEVHETNRGGKVTYHGPGQLVGYPIVNLSPDRRDVRRYVQDLQEVLIRTLAELGITARRGEEQALIGVWVGEAKIASLGVHLSRWISVHGFALNVATDLSPFAGIVACGLPDVRMTSIEQLTGRRLETEDVGARVAHHFGAVFGRGMVVVEPGKVLDRQRKGEITVHGSR